MNKSVLVQLAHRLVERAEQSGALGYHAIAGREAGAGRSGASRVMQLPPCDAERQTTGRVGVRLSAACL